MLRRATLLSLLLVGLLSPVEAKPWLERQGSSVLAEGQRVQLKVVTLRNWLVPDPSMWGLDARTSPRQIRRVVADLLGPEEAARFWTQYSDRYVASSDLMGLRMLGVNCVRIPIDADAAADLTRLDTVVKTCQDLGMWVLFDYAPAGTPGPEAEREALAMWPTVAEHYRDEPNVLGYEILTPRVLTKDTVKELYPIYRRAARAIRGVDPRHLLVLDVDLSRPPGQFDPRVIYLVEFADQVKTGLKPYFSLLDSEKLPLILEEGGGDLLTPSQRQELEQRGVGWSYRYKEANSEDSLCIVQLPEGWQEIVRYARAANEPESVKAGLRPAPERCRAIFGELLENIRWTKVALRARSVEAVRDDQDWNGALRPRGFGPPKPKQQQR